MSTLFTQQPAPKTFRVLPTERERGQAEVTRTGERPNHAAILDDLRCQLQAIYERRVIDVGRGRAFVTADDARPLLEARSDCPRKKNFLGHLFRTGGWEPTGAAMPSSTRGSHGNLLRCWRYVGDRR